MRKISCFLFIALVLSGCSLLNPGIMLKTKRDFKFSEYKDTLGSQYKIYKNDNLLLRVYSNDGFKLIELTGESNISAQGASAQGGITGMQYLVEFDGTVKLPVLGRFLITGMTVRQAELTLEKMFAEYYNKPFVILTVTNRRVIVFPGQEGRAQVLGLINENTTLLEAIALAGGVTSTGKAKKIKLIRTNPGNTEKPDIYMFDLSVVEGIKYGNIILQANDIIYIEPRIRFLREITSEILVPISLLSSTLLIYTTYKLLTAR